MTKWLGSLLVLGALGLFAACENQGGGDAGGPGADTTDADTEPQQEEKTFTVESSTDSLELKPGQRQEMTLTISRGAEFDQTVEVQVETPEGVKVYPEGEPIEIGPGETETTIMIGAEEGAPAGQEQTMTVTFQPETGEPITQDMKVMVQEPENAQGQQQQTNEQQQ